MKQLKKVGALMLAVCMIVGVAACGEKEPAPTSQPTSQEPVIVANNDKDDSTTEIVANDDVNKNDPYEIIKDANGNPVNLGGITVELCDWWYAGESEPNNEYAEAQLEWRNWLQETYNFKMVGRNYSTWANMPTDFVNYATTGSDEYLIFTLYAGPEATNAINQGLMYDLSTLDCLDFTEDKWDAGIMGYGRRGSKICTMRGEVSEPRNGLYFNKKILRESGIDPDDLYKWMDNGTWTWDKFEEVCEKVQKDFDNDGVIDRYAMTSMHALFYPSAIFSNNSTLINIDENGEFYSALESEATLEALNWAKEMRTKYEMPQPADSNWDYFYAAFNAGEACFQCDQAYRAGTMIDACDFDYGFICFPKGPRATDYIAYTENNMYCIPAVYSPEKAWKIAFAYNLWTQPVPGWETYPSWKYAYYNNFHDTESVDDTIARLIDPKNNSARFDQAVYGLIGNDGLGGALLMWQLDSRTPAEILEEIRGTVQDYLDQHNGKK